MLISLLIINGLNVAKRLFGQSSVFVSVPLESVKLLVFGDWSVKELKNISAFHCLKKLATLYDFFAIIERQCNY